MLRERSAESRKGDTTDVDGVGWWHGVGSTTKTFRNYKSGRSRKQRKMLERAFRDLFRCFWRFVCDCGEESDEKREYMKKTEEESKNVNYRVTGNRATATS